MRILLLLLTFAVFTPLSAGVALMVGEPFGKFGFFNPTGHGSIYLSRVCAETPTLLRRCEPGELGTVISRYNRVAGRDWLAMPLLPYLYGVERSEDVPTVVDEESIARIRDAYRRRHLRDLIPDGPDGSMPPGDWVQLVGSSFDRNVYVYFVETSPHRDDELIEFLNAQENRRRFNLFYRNCVDFSKDILNFYFPKSIRRNVLADAGISTPKQAAKSLVNHVRKNPELEFAYLLVPQIPGLPSSTKLRGVSESLVRSKKYVVPLVVFQPWVAVTAGAAYLTTGRFNPKRLPITRCDSGLIPTCVADADPIVLVAGEDIDSPLGTDSEDGPS
jgi:hypothetical protein